MSLHNDNIKIPSKVLTFVRRIDKTHKGLGLPILFSHISVLAQKSVFFIADVGVGKGTIINATQKIRDKADMQKWDTVTLRLLAKRIGVCRNAILLWKIEEWSTLSQYHREQFLTVISKVITDRNYFHDLSLSPKHPLVIDIKDSDLTTLLAIQPLKYMKMVTENENWESLSRDRFVKFALLNPLRDDTVRELPKTVLPKIDHEYKTRIKTDLSIMLHCFKGQASIGRVKLYAEDYLKAYCQFLGDKTAFRKHELQFGKLFFSYLRLYDDMIYPTDIAKPLKLNIGALRLLQAVAQFGNEVTQKDILNYFHFQDMSKSDTVLRRYYNYLHHRGLMNKIKAYNPVTYGLNGYARDFFNWYRGLFL